MKRRNVLAGALGAICGAGPVAYVERADVVLRPGMQLAKGEPATISLQTDSADGEDNDELSRSDDYPSQDRWAAVEMKGIAAERLLDILERRFEGPVEGVMTGVQYLLFGPTVSLERVTGFGWDDQQIDTPRCIVWEIRHGEFSESHDSVSRIDSLSQILLLSWE